ncbi:hypothetical protein [Polyangium aurulentum]|uniref:hypothetical protein n=1 Tax=Polyangium aurulentum TaxID=2567896 RepID=UPI0010AEC596|nr:hypothetical protein [Polyangium aurulentum]UQA57338.1 hypothetical protein E8A73_039590 [Polyangium aurulentum]
MLSMRSILVLVAASLALSTTACSSLTKPDEITIKAEPAPAPPAPAPPQQPAAPGDRQAAPTAAPGGGG